MFRNIDATYGCPNLEKIAINCYNELSEEDKLIEYTLAEKFKRDFQKNWLLQLLCTYPTSNFKLGDSLWYKHIKKMVLDGTLYMQTFNLDHWAFPDKEESNNINNIKKLGFDIDLVNKRNSDGLFSSGRELELLRVYQSDKDTPDVIDDRITMYNAYGVVEFGRQKVSKTAMTLLNNDILLRVPYKSKLFEEPMGAIFYNTAPYYEKLK